MECPSYESKQYHSNSIDLKIKHNNFTEERMKKKIPQIIICSENHGISFDCGPICSNFEKRDWFSSRH